MDSLSGNHDRIFNPEPSRVVAAKRQPHDCRLVWKELPGLSSFLHKRWASIILADRSPHIALSILPCLDRSLASRHFLFGVPALKGTLSYFAEIAYSLEMPEISRFDCPNCRAEYKLVRAEVGPLPDRQIVCRRCDAPLQGREGKFILKYFFVGRPRT
jgi:hypothetical protein